MAFWQIFGKSAVSDQGETIQRLATPRVSAAEEQSSATWALQLWDQMGQSSPKLALSAATAVPEWAVQLLV